MGLRSLLQTTLKAAVAVEDSHGRVFFRGTTVSARRVAVLVVPVLLVAVVSFSLVVSLAPVPTARVVQETAEPKPPATTAQPLATTAEPAPTTTAEPPATIVEPVPATTDETGLYRTGEAVGEQLGRLWQDTKELSRGLWHGLTD